MGRHQEWQEFDKVKTIEIIGQEDDKIRFNQLAIWSSWWMWTPADRQTNPPAPPRTGLCAQNSVNSTVILQ